MFMLKRYLRRIQHFQNNILLSQTKLMVDIFSIINKIDFQREKSLNFFQMLPISPLGPVVSLAIADLFICEELYYIDNVSGLEP